MRNMIAFLRWVVSTTDANSGPIAAFWNGVWFYTEIDGGLGLHWRCGLLESILYSILFPTHVPADGPRLISSE